MRWSSLVRVPSRPWAAVRLCAAPLEVSVARRIFVEPAAGSLHKSGGLKTGARARQFDSGTTHPPRGDDQQRSRRPHHRAKADGGGHRRAQIFAKTGVTRQANVPCIVYAMLWRAGRQFEPPEKRHISLTYIIAILASTWGGFRVRC